MIRLPCQSCGSKLKLPDYAAGKKAQCPQCFTVFLVSTSNAPDTLRPTPNPSRQLEAVVEIDEEVPRSKPRPNPGKRQVGVAVESREEDAVVELDLDEPPSPTRPNKAVPPPRVDRPKKPKKKKKKSAKSRDPVDVPGWVWWTAGVGGAAALCVIAAVVAVLTGHTFELFYYGIRLAVMLPVTTIILIISMVISSQLAGGIDFGEVSTAIAKTLLLLFAVNVIYLVPFGLFLSIPIWLLGLMYLFNLDFWETRFLFFINWVLTYAARYAMMAMLMSGLQNLPSTIDKDDQPAIHVPAMDHDGDSKPDDDE